LRLDVGGPLVCSVPRLAAPAMIGRVWGFLKRHKKKFFFGTLAAGGAAYAAWQFLLPRVSNKILQRLLKEIAKESENATNEDAERRRRERFEHKQQVSDTHARRKLAALRSQQINCFKVEACNAKLKEGRTREEKLEAFTALSVECLAKAASALYMWFLLVLLHRVAFNIVGRELAEGPERAGANGEADGAGEADDDGAHAAFLQALDHLQEAGCEQIGEAVRQAVQVCLERAKLAPTVAIDGEGLQKFLADCCREADSGLVGNARAGALLLPDSLDGRAAPEQRGEVKRLLDEARDYLDSPQFVQVFQASTAQGAKLLAEALVLDIAGVAGGEGPWPLAKFNPALIKLGGAMLEDAPAAEAEAEAEVEAPAEGAADAAPAVPSAGIAAALARGFAQEPRVEELCNGLYFQGR